MPFPLIPVLGGMLGLGSLFNESSNAALAAQVSRENTDKTIQAQKDMAQYAYTKDVEMWDRANAYNNPVQQMARLRDAGLNPMLLYGTGTAASAGNAASSMPHYQAPNLEYKYVPNTPNFGAAITQFQNLAMMSAQVDNVKAQTNATLQKTANDALTNVILAADANVAPALRAAELKRARGEAQSAEVTGSFAERLASLGYQRGLSQAEVERVGAKYAEVLKSQEARRGDVGVSRESFELSQRRRLGPYDLAVRQYEAAKAKADASLAAGALDVQSAGLKKLGLESKSVELENVYKEFVNRLAGRGYTAHDPWYVRQFSKNTEGFDPEGGYERFKKDIDRLKSNWFGGREERRRKALITTTKHR